MGFIDFIHEKAIDRIGGRLDLYYPGFIPAQEPQHCPLCAQQFESAAELISHIRLRHPLGLPLLTLDHHLPTRDCVVRTPLTHERIAVENCTQIQVAETDGVFHAISKEQFRELLVEKKEGILLVRLVNERSLDAGHATTQHRLNFRIPLEGAMEEIEARFIQTMSTYEISVATSRRFWDSCDSLVSNPAGADYANALANYLVGLAIKQGSETDARQPFAKYKEKYLEANSVLEHLKAPLATTVSSIIRFSLNNFSQWHQALLSVPDIGLASRLFNAPAATLDVPPIKRQAVLESVGKCPVDELTRRIAEAARMILEGKVDDSALDTLLPPLFEWDPLPEYDLQKIKVLMVVWNLKRKRLEIAVPHLRDLRADPQFKNWASKILGASDFINTL